MDPWTLIIIIVLLVYITSKVIQMKNYFGAYGIPQPFELPFFGLLDWCFISKQHFNLAITDVYNVNKEAKYIGCYTFSNPVLMIRDLDLIKSILVKNFDHFAYHKHFVDEEVDPLFGKNLIFLNGERWREVRNILSPSFTSSKMRSMYELMLRCAESFVGQLQKLTSGHEAIDMKDVFTRFTNDVIATCAFGIEIDSLKNPENDFYTHGRRATSSSTSQMMKFFLLRMFPNLCRKIGVRVVSKKDTEFFINVIKTTLEMRKKQGIVRPDMLQLMINARVKSNNLDIIEMTAQAFIFFLGGFESTSSQLCMIAQELAMNPDCQRKLQHEVDNVMKKGNGKPDYDTVNDLPYLDAVFSEVLRLHSIAFLNRMCSKDFELPPSLPTSKPFTVKEGMELMIPVAAIHRDPQYFENPEKFDPDRYLDKKAASSDVMSMGFGLGPRMCIGNRFAILETKVLLLHLLSKYDLVVCEKTCIPLQYDKKNFAPTPKGGCWLQLKPRNE
ncbi:hypothetical protein QAD02_010852 [Eretmocerus hayati]|uniref:Uncharacterized protein n=1 Tax=Eretmocerus hayati TaxID=131215 RepID=A0ACC2NV73_9HYME|nr:hypothetical protein QAD02_010852 [Eretmocerus hayati]